MLDRIGMRRRASSIATLLAVGALVLAGPAALAAPGARAAGSAPAAGAPALNGWTVGSIIDPDGGLTSGGFAVTGARSGVIAYRSSKTTYVRRTTDSGATWSARVQISPTGKQIRRVSMATYGRNVDVLQESMTAAWLRHSGDGGKTWSANRSVSVPGALPRIARGPGGLMAMIGFDSDGPRWRVKVSQDGGMTWGAAKTVGLWELTGGDLPATAVAVAGDSIVVLFTNEDQHLVTRRSTNGGGSWSSPVTIGTDGSLFVGSLVVSGSTVVAAYAQDADVTERLVVRRSTNGGGAWSAAIPFGVDVTGAVVGHGQGAWHLVSSDLSGTWRYRGSSNGLAWSGSEVIDTGHDLISPPIGVGAFTGGAAAAFVDADGLDEQIWFARD